jgi:hypothetical protein
MAADFCAFVMYKIARGDLIWWMPGAAIAHCVCALAMRHLMVSAVRCMLG